MLRATGSASCVQTGIVAATQARRVSSSGVVGQRGEVDDLVEPQRGDLQGLVEARALLGGDCRWPDAARSSPWRTATLQSMPVAAAGSSPAAAG